MAAKLMTALFSMHMADACAVVACVKPYNNLNWPLHPFYIYKACAMCHMPFGKLLVRSCPRLSDLLATNIHTYIATNIADKRHLHSLIDYC